MSLLHDPTHEVTFISPDGDTKIGPMPVTVIFGDDEENEGREMVAAAATANDEIAGWDMEVVQLSDKSVEEISAEEAKEWWA